MLLHLELFHKAISLYKSCVRYKITSTVYKHILKDTPKVQVFETTSGLTVATQERKCGHACLGIFINTGSRHEDKTLNGVTYFFQHLVYKGTLKQTKTDLEREMSNIGAKFKCCTTRDMTSFYVECLASVSTCAIDILFNCIFNNAYPNPEIEIQKDLIYQEMLEHDQCPSKVLHDYLHSTAFQGTPLSQTIMGLSENLSNFNSNAIRDYMSKIFVPTKMVLASVGGVKHDVMVNLVEQNIRKSDACSQSASLGPARYTGSQLVYRDDSMNVGYIAIAVEGPSFCHEDKLCIDLASSAIGGWDGSQPGGTNHGTRVAYIASSGNLCEYYKTFNYSYEDTGLWGVEFVSPKEEVDDMVLTIQDEWMRLCHMMTDGELLRAKNELKSKIIMNYNSTVETCLELGQNILRTGYYPHFLEKLDAIDQITAKQLKNVCDKYIYDRCPVVVGIGATEALLPYPRIRSYMYWLRI